MILLLAILYLKCLLTHYCLNNIKNFNLIYAHLFRNKGYPEQTYNYTEMIVSPVTLDTILMYIHNEHCPFFMASYFHFC